MADPKDTTSFFRKVVKFVANPATEWSDLEPPSAEARETEFAKSELKAMIERKRRNDFVRKREFDMLRKVRREGLSSEQLAAISRHPAGDRMGRRCLLHTVEHLGLHLGHVESTIDWWKATRGAESRGAE